MDHLNLKQKSHSAFIVPATYSVIIYVGAGQVHCIDTTWCWKGQRLRGEKNRGLFI